MQRQDSAAGGDIVRRDKSATSWSWGWFDNWMTDRFFERRSDYPDEDFWRLSEYQIEVTEVFSAPGMIKVERGSFQSLLKELKGAFVFLLKGFLQEIP